VNYMVSAVGMVWRAVLIWMFILVLVTLAAWFGV
jgi:hypothetical protein